jgi:hypothetical protein|tara:strand:- start:354 stop:689 length:336 start_codon:yes stop_codon:yes gene_type:complete
MKSFLKHLNQITYATNEQKEKELWDVSGVLKDRLNENLKFDIRPMFEHTTGEPAKRSNAGTKADKMVIEEINRWVVLDVKELIENIKQNKKTVLRVEDLLKILDWNIIILK